MMKNNPENKNDHPFKISAHPKFEKNHFLILNNKKESYYIYHSKLFLKVGKETISCGGLRASLPINSFGNAQNYRLTIVKSRGATFGRLATMLRVLVL